MLSDERLLGFCRALSDTVRSGLSLGETFEILSRSPEYGRFLAGAAKMTAGGSQLHEALAAQKIFPPVFTALVRAGEEGGKTEEFLALYADCLEVRIDFRRRIGRALIYPAFAVLLAAALLLIGVFKVIPLLMGPFFTSGADAPRVLVFFGGLAGFFSKYWAPALLAACLAALGLKTFMSSRPGRALASLAGHWLPVFRYAAGEARLYHIYTMIGLLLKAGLAPGAMMDVMLQFAENDPVTRRRLARAAAMLSGGDSFSESFGRIFPREDLNGLAVAERAGRLDETALRLGKVHYDRHLHRLKLLVTGLKIAASVSIALLAFGLLAVLLQPVLTALTDTRSVFPVPPAARAPSGAAQPQVSYSGTQPLPNSYVVDDPTALFNQKSGKEILEMMKKTSALKGTGAPGVPKPEAASTETARTDRKTLVPNARIKSVNFKKMSPGGLKPTPIKPTEIRQTEIKTGIQ